MKVLTARPTVDLWVRVADQSGERPDSLVLQGVQCDHERLVPLRNESGLCLDVRDPAQQLRLPRRDV